MTYLLEVSEHLISSPLFMNSSFYIPPPYPFPNAWPELFAKNSCENQIWLTPTTQWMNPNTLTLLSMHSNPTELTDSDNSDEQQQNGEEESKNQATYRVVHVLVIGNY